MKFEIYRESKDGIVTYQGASGGWRDEKECVLEEGYFKGSYRMGRFGRDMPEPVEREMRGWPHRKVRWYGDIGIACE